MYNFASETIFCRENFCGKFSFWEFIFADRGKNRKNRKN